MRTVSLKLIVSSEIGKVSAECYIPEKPICVMVLAHGAGANMDHAFMKTLSAALSEEGIATMRFNFPFMENKKGRPDSPAVAHATIKAAIEKAVDLFPKVPLFLSGKSFGGRMSSQYLATQTEHDIKGIVFYGFPLHATGKPSTDRADHLKTVKVPMLFLQGSKDTLAEWKLIESVCKPLKKAKLVKFEGADHSFKAGKQDIMSLLVKETKDWITKIK